MQSAFASSRDGRRFIPSTSSLPNGSQLRRGEPESNGSSMFRGSEPISARTRSISESAVKANWRFGSDAARASELLCSLGQSSIAFADAILIRPAIMFGPDDAFLTTILKLLDQLPIYPMFGNGQMRLQPVYVEDVGQAIVKVLQRAQTRQIMFECGGPRVYSYEEFLKAVASAAGIKPILIPVPFAAWHALAWIAEMLPRPPITRNQVELMQVDSVSSPDIPGLGELGISPHSIEEILQDVLWEH